MTSDRDPSRNPNRDRSPRLAADAIDRRLRAALDPAPGQAHRLVREVLDDRRVEASRIREIGQTGWPGWKGPARVAAGAGGLAVLLIAGWAAWSATTSRSAPETFQATATSASNPPNAPSIGPSADSSLPTRLTISNLEGALTVTSPSGATAVILATPVALED